MIRKIRSNIGLNKGTALTVGGIILLGTVGAIVSLKLKVKRYEDGEANDRELSKMNSELDEYIDAILYNIK